MIRSCSALLPTLLIAASLCRFSPALADEKRQSGPDFSKGMLRGKVVDAVTGKPVSGATVALQNKDGKVITWTKTDSTGIYSLAVDSRRVLNLQPSHRRGLLDEIARDVGEVASVPVKVAEGIVDTVKKTSPAETVKNAALSTATGNPLPVAAQIVNTMTPVNRARSLPTDAANQTKEAAVRVAFGERLADRQAKRPALAPGEVFVAVTGPDYKEVKGKAGTYWLEPAVAPDKSSRQDRGRGVCAWMETVKLAPSSAADKKSEVENEAILLSDAHVAPALLPAGSACSISVRLQSPPEPATKARVFARESRKRTVVELKPQGKGVFAGELTIDPKCPSGDTKVSIAAMREEPLDVRLPKKGDALLLFAGRIDEMDPTKPYAFDPRIMASENRLDATITVLDPKTQTPLPRPPTEQKKPDTGK